MTDRKQALADLIEKVEAGDFPADMCAFDLGLKGVEDINDVYEAFSGSLDAAEALHEAVLPDQSVKIERRVGGWVVWLDHPFKGVSDDPARAWLLAILKALHAQEEHA